MKDPPAPGPREFETTHWSLVVAARPGEASQSRAREALEELCRAYWFPLYAFARCRGYSSEDAQDMTQSFFARILEKRGFAGADPGLGRFRSYLLGAMKHFMANEYHRARAKKRGGGAVIIELDALEPEARYALEPGLSNHPDPDAEFDRKWAEESVARAMKELQAESEERGKGALFKALKGSLTGDEPDRSNAAERFRMSDGAIKTAIHRFRRRFRELLRAEIAKTIAHPSDIDAEMRHLVAALRKDS